eukprot:scaffold818_cov136-Cylindrotheca_fusiformis.AAC.11
MSFWTASIVWDGKQSCLLQRKCECDDSVVTNIPTVVSLWIRSDRSLEDSRMCHASYLVNDLGGVSFKGAGLDDCSSSSRTRVMCHING